jgi:hypothetical protein
MMKSVKRLFGRCNSFATGDFPSLDRRRNAAVSRQGALCPGVRFPAAFAGGGTDVRTGRLTACVPRPFVTACCPISELGWPLRMNRSPCLPGTPAHPHLICGRILFAENRFPLFGTMLRRAEANPPPAHPRPLPVLRAGGQGAARAARFTLSPRTSRCPCRRRCTGWRGPSSRRGAPSHRAGW